MTFVERADLFRVEASRKLDPRRRSELGQFLTPGPVARFMATFFEKLDDRVRLLEAGAGVGTLFAAVAAEAIARPARPSKIDVEAFEIDPAFTHYLAKTVGACRVACRHAGIQFHGKVSPGDFIEAGVELLRHGSSSPKSPRRFTHAILNPPYKKLGSQSAARRSLRRVGIETSNLYAAFVALAIQLLEPGGEMVAITPRSFCNGPYFRGFRKYLLKETAIRRVHLFESRTAAFSDDGVLQENVILHVVKGRSQGRVVVSSSSGQRDDVSKVREVPFSHIVRPGDPEHFIHLASNDLGQRIAEAFALLPASLADLGMSVSTGKVVDFRAKKFLRRDRGPNTRPLIYPAHFSGGVVEWPKVGKKPNGLVDAPRTSELWMPRGIYVLVKRFSSNEERRRVVAAIFDPRLVPADKVGFENHLNVFHVDGEGLDSRVARGLATFLNSTFLDTYFRQFNGHTQVNATDLRNLRYPSLATLRRLSRRIGQRASQTHLDEAVHDVLELRLKTRRRSRRPEARAARRRS